MKERDHLAAQRSVRWTRKMDKSLPAPSCDNPDDVYGENVGKIAAAITQGENVEYACTAHGRKAAGHIT